MSAHGVEFSDDDPGTIEVAALTPSRFLLQRERLLPYRDAPGRINVPLLERAHAALADGRITVPPQLHDRVVAWVRHAKAWRAARVGAKRPRDAAGSEEPDEALTIDELFTAHMNDVIARRLVGLAPPTPKRARRAAEMPKTQRRESRVARPLRRLRRTVSATLGEGCKGLHADGSAGASSVRSLSLTSGRSQSDVYEVERLLDERRGADGAAFLVRWAGYAPEHDTWEPECHVVPHLVASFREAKALAADFSGRDYGERRSRQLWCARCRRHFHVDNFSSRARRADPAERRCLLHSAMLR